MQGYTLSLIILFMFAIVGIWSYVQISNLEKLVDELYDDLAAKILRIDSLRKEIRYYETQYEELKNKTLNNKYIIFEATAYDLSINSCGKDRDDKYFGITANGTNLVGKTRKEAMAVAVDPEVIPLGSRLMITFDEPYKHFTGVYTAVDTGSAIKGAIVDVFMGDFYNVSTHQSVWDFGRQKVKVRRID